MKKASYRPAPVRNQLRNHVVIEVLGGVVQAVYSDRKDMRVIVADWDEYPEAKVAGRFPLDRLSRLSTEMLHEVQKALPSRRLPRRT